MDATDRSQTCLGLGARHWLWLLIAYFTLLSIQYAYKAGETPAPGKLGKTAILRWYTQLVELGDGEDIYEKSAYPNPPIMALILTPIVRWPELFWSNVGGWPLVAAGLVWFYLKVGMTLLCLRWVFKMIETPSRPFPLWGKVLTVLLSLRAITGDLQHGNVNLFILFLVVAALYALQNGRDFLGGLLVALAMSCKVTPGLFVPYLIWKRAWRSLAGCVVGVALFFWPGVVPAQFLGWKENLKDVASWTDRMVKPFVAEGQVWTEHNNQSLPGLVYRLLTDSPSFIKYVDDQLTPDRFHNFLSLSTTGARWVIKLCMGLFVLLIIWTCRTPREQRPGSNPQLAAEYSLIVIGMLLFSERTWKHHCVTLLLPFAVLCYHLAVWRARPALRRCVLASLVVAELVMSTTSISLLGRDFGKMAEVYGAYIAAFLVLIAALTVILRQSRNDAVAGLKQNSAPSLAA